MDATRAQMPTDSLRQRGSPVGSSARECSWREKESHCQEAEERDSHQKSVSSVSMTWFRRIRQTRHAGFKHSRHRPRRHTRDLGDIDMGFC